MPKPEEIQDATLRELVTEAHGEMRRGRGTEAVVLLADAYLHLLKLQPEMLEETIEPRPGFKMRVVMRWPMLGANLKMESLATGQPEIDFIRERFAVSEAMTYYQYLLETALERKA